MLACAAFTSDDLPMPRAPHNSALLAGYPLAKRSVFSRRMSRSRSIPRSRPISTRLTRGTGASRPLGCQMKASALASTSAFEPFGDVAGRPAAMASSARAILSATSSSQDGDGRFVAGFGDFAEAAFETAREADFLGFFDMS